MSAGSRVGLALAVAMLAAVGLATVYVQGGQPQLEGLLIAVVLGSVGAAVVVWAKRLMPTEEITEERPELASSEEDRAGVVDELGTPAVERRRVLRWLLGGAAGTAALAFLFPIRSLGPVPGGALTRTPWRRGTRAVDTDGQPVSFASVDIGNVVTVFPEGHVGAADAQALLIGVDRDLLGDEATAAAAGDLVAYSKLCTHLACPVGLYQQDPHLLLCPCHQSTFDVLSDGQPAFGPAARPLPLLPIAVDEEGVVVARGDYLAPVGTGYWYRPE